MPKNIPYKDLRTQGFVLRRTNYGEADRILNIITPEGKISAIAKGARKEKSKLAGGIEFFTLTKFNIHQGKSDFGVVTSAKMMEYYKNILKDFERMELAGLILKKINAVADFGGEGYFEIVKQSLTELDAGMDVRLIESWFWLNLTKAMGEEVNLYRDNAGEKLVAGVDYNWNTEESVFWKNEKGEFETEDIKMLRLMLTGDLKIVKRVKLEEKTIEKILNLARIIGKN